MVHTYKWQVVLNCTKEIIKCMHSYTGSSGHVFVSLVLIVVSCHLFTPVVGQPSWDHSLCVWHRHHIPAVSQCKYGQVGFAAHNYNGFPLTVYNTTCVYSVA